MSSASEQFAKNVYYACSLDGYINPIQPVDGVFNPIEPVDRVFTASVSY